LSFIAVINAILSSQQLEGLDYTVQGVELDWAEITN